MRSNDSEGAHDGTYNRGETKYDRLLTLISRHFVRDKEESQEEITDDIAW